MKNALIGIGAFIGMIFIVFVLWLSFTASGREAWHNYRHGLKKADETSYEVRKQVEDTARSYIVSYTNAKLKYEIELEACKEHPSIDEGASNSCRAAYISRRDANTIATQYNEYILKNSYVWDGNIPSDISMELYLIY